METLCLCGERGSLTRLLAGISNLRYQIVSRDINEITRAIIGAAIEVHRQLGPGLLESAYLECLCRELTLRGIPFEREKPLPLEYKGIRLECGYRLDLLVEGCVVVEIKSMEALAPVHDAQLLTYLRLGGWRVGLLINFNVAVLKNGIHRKILGYELAQAAPGKA